MSFEPAIIPRLMQSVLKRTRSVLGTDMAVVVTGAHAQDCGLTALDLHDTTAIAGLSGPVQLLIAFSFSAQLLEVLFERFTADIRIPDDERDLHLRETAAELANIVLGRCTADLQIVDRAIVLTPPVVIDGARRILRPKHAVFASMRIDTEHGHLDVSFVGPPELFDSQLNILKEGDHD